MSLDFVHTLECAFNLLAMQNGVKFLCLANQKQWYCAWFTLFSASMEPTSNNSNCALTKEQILVQIESRNHSAAAVLCQCYRYLSVREPQNHLMEGIFGLVALLGTVGTSKLSRYVAIYFIMLLMRWTLSTFLCKIFSFNVFNCRILAEFLGEDQMLAVVCRSKETASAFAQSISGRFLVICLEDIRCYNRLLLEFWFLLICTL